MVAVAAEAVAAVRHINYISFHPLGSQSRVKNGAKFDLLGRNKHINMPLFTCNFCLKRIKFLLAIFTIVIKNQHNILRASQKN